MPKTTPKIIFGPPGTGKTTKILSLISENLKKGYTPEDIVYLSFTRKAALEGAMRVAEAFESIDSNRFKGFSTIHSLCFKYTNTEVSEVLNDFDWSNIGKKLGLFFTAGQAVGGAESGHNVADRYRDIYQYAKNRQISYDQAYTEKLASTGLTKQPFIQCCTTIDKYCEANYKIGFHTMLERFIAQDTPLPQPIIYVDEAQDLSLLQCRTIEVAARDADELIFAGDDDQAIFGWAGACSEYLLDNNYEKIFLDKSYRIPSRVHKEAEKLIMKNRKRQEKAYIPKEEEGQVTRLSDLNKLDLQKGTWYLLARTHSMLEPFFRHCLSNHLLFHTDSSKEQDMFGCSMEDAVEAINSYARLKKGYPISKEKALNMLKFMVKGKDKGYKPGAIGAVTAMEEDLIPAEVLLDTWCVVRTTWQEALKRFPARMRQYLSTASEKGERFDKRHRIVIGTIHSVKGGEAENVVIRAKGLSPDRVTDMEEERRVWYVGITRTMKNLYILDIDNNDEEII